MNNEERKRKIANKLISRILKDNNIRMNISSCTECETPHITFEYYGNLIVLDMNDIGLEMIDNSELIKFNKNRKPSCKS